MKDGSSITALLHYLVEGRTTCRNVALHNDAHINTVTIKCYKNLKLHPPPQLYETPIILVSMPCMWLAYIAALLTAMVADRPPLTDWVGLSTGSRFRDRT